MAGTGARLWRPLAIFLYVSGLAFFYRGYVPLAASFQVVFVPLLAAGGYLAWKDLRKGTLFFIGAFPLVNSLPYFFGIAEPLPFAPPALVLFLFVFLGFLLRRREAEDWPVLLLQLRAPLLSCGLLVFVSAAVTAYRYANFFPFLSPRFLELTVNAYGVHAGGALMSVILTAATYLTGMAFFWVLSRTLRTKQDIRAALAALGAGSLLSLAFAFIQHIGCRELGVNPTTILLQLVNGTFKDAMALGAFASMAAPLFLGAALAARGAKARIAAGLVVLAALTGLLVSGSKIALFAILAAAVYFAASAGLVFAGRPGGRGVKGKGRRRMVPAVFLATALLASGLAVLGKPIFRALNGPKIVERFKDSERMVEWRIQAQWLPAVRMAGQHPLTGVGVGAFIIEAPNITGLYKARRQNPESAENFVLQIVSEMGIAGVLLAAWLLAALARTIRAGRRACPERAGRRSRLLAIGASSGLLAFAIDAQMHSYIGSPEVHYLLWFLVGLLFALSRPQAEECPSGMAKSKPPRLPMAAAAVVFLAYGGVHLWNSTHALSLPARTRALGLARNFGLYAPERAPDGGQFRWTREYGGIPLVLEKPVVVIRLRAAHPDLRRRPVRVRFFWVEDVFRRRTFIREVSISEAGWKTVELPAPGRPGSQCVLYLETDRTWNPKRALGVNDARNLGVAVGPLEFRDR